MATTARGIVYPTTSTTLTPLANHFASLATSSNTALDNLENAGARMIGTDAARIALTAPKLKEGLTWYSTDTDREWFYNGTAWVAGEYGSVLMRPSSAFGTGASIASDGGITITSAGAGVYVGANGVFTTRFKRYTVEFYLNGASSTSVSMRFLAGGSAITAANYNTNNSYFTGSTQGGSSATSQSQATVSVITTASTLGNISVTNPADGSVLTNIRADGNGGNIPWITGGNYNATTAVDGIAITAQAGPFSGWLKVFGEA